MKLRCTVCREYVQKEDAIRVGIVSFCSESCRTKKSYMKKSKASEPMPQALRDEVLSVDSSRCRYCGTTKMLHAHHAIYRSQGGKHEISNLIMLCDEHHALVHSDKRRFQPLVLGVIAAREQSGDMTTTIPMIERNSND